LITFNKLLLGIHFRELHLQALLCWVYAKVTTASFAWGHVLIAVLSYHRRQYTPICYVCFSRQWLNTKL
jgi:hypothetical protein